MNPRQSSILIKVQLITALSLLLAACQSAPRDQPSAENPSQTQIETVCENPRPEFCTREYRPVCALKDTGIRCVTTPCDSTEWVTYSNGCAACSDEKVFGYRSNTCEE